MTQPHAMKDLGYPRTPTSASMRVAFPCGETWSFPAQVVADSRDARYADEKEDTVGAIRAGSLDDGTLTEWAINQMDWCDVAPFAVQVPHVPPKPNYGREWMRADRSIVGPL